MIRTCRVCGKRFEGHWASTLCSDECKKVRRKEINKEFWEKQKGVHYGDDPGKKKSDISADITEARKQGVSYGYYMAMRDGRL